MAKLATFTITGSLVGEESSETISLQLTNPNSPGQMSIVPLDVGRNNVSFIGTWLYVLVIPPPASTNIKTWDATSTTGGRLGTATPSLISVPPGTSSINIGSAGIENVKVYFW